MNNDADRIEDLSIKKAKRTIEEYLIRRALIVAKGNRTRAAKLLEISPNALLYKIEEYGIGYEVPIEPSSEIDLDSWREELRQEAERPKPKQQPARVPTEDDFDSILPMREAIASFRRAHLSRALKLSGGNKTRAAELLGMDPRTVFRCLEGETDEC